MESDGDEESSDSSNDFLVPADQINLNSSFFSAVTKPSQSNVKKTKTKALSTSEESSDEEFVSNEAIDSTELFSQVIQNLERYNASLDNPEENQPGTSKSQDPRQSKPSEKGKRIGNTPHSTNNLYNEINDLLLQGEASLGDVSENDPDDDKPDTEAEPAEYTIPKEGVQITLPTSTFMFDHRKRNKLDLETRLRNRLNQRLRTNQIFIHKVGLLCWLAHGFHLNKLINDSEVMSTALSHVSSNNYPKGRVDLNYLEKFVKWFRKGFELEEKNADKVVLSTETLLRSLREKKVYSYKVLVLLFISLLRAMGLNCRLVVNLIPPRMKVARDQLIQPKGSKNNESEKDADKKNGKKDEKGKSKSRKDTKSNKKDSNKESPSKKIEPENSQEADKTAKMEARKKAAAVLQSKTIGRNKKRNENEAKDEKEPQKAEVKEKQETETPPLAKRLRSRNNAKPETKESGKDDNTKKNVTSKATEKGVANKHKAQTKAVEEIECSPVAKRLRSNIIQQPPNAAKSTKLKLKVLKSSVSSNNNEYDSESEDSEAEFKKKPVKQRQAVKSVETKKQTKNNRKLISSEDEDEVDPTTQKNRQDVWVEVYVESEESWISVCLSDEKIHCVSDIFKKATIPVLYIIAWNSNGSLKDVTRRYCPHWLTVTRKQRIEEKWWAESLSPWKEKSTAISKAEDEMLLQKELEQPLPTTVGECKGHPLYALARHLLKYEALYPRDAVPLGRLKNGEEIFSRHCVHTLCSRETWLKQARVVKPAQEPYKIVKAMPKYDKLSGQLLKDQPLELFGKWQTTDYDPPEAKNGIVPRNEYGNVDLFKQCMLPKGTVHIDLPGLNRIARKLNIDCPPAVVGFNFGGMGAVPAFEGFVVCKEFEDTLREAWETEQVEAAKRAKEKREKRVYGNWRKLIKGLLIRERLAAKYGFENKSKAEETAAAKKRTKYTVTCTKRKKRY